MFLFALRQRDPRDPLNGLCRWMRELCPCSVSSIWLMGGIRGYRRKEGPYFQSGEEIFTFFSPISWYKAAKGRATLIRRKREGNSRP